MKTADKLTGMALAAAAAALFAATPVTATAGSDAKTGHCVGVNACKGKSSCATSGNQCKGMNACKGKGFVMVDKATCDQLGGKFEAK